MLWVAQQRSDSDPNGFVCLTLTLHHLYQFLRCSSQEPLWDYSCVQTGHSSQWVWRYRGSCYEEQPRLCLQWCSPACRAQQQPRIGIKIQTSHVFNQMGFFQSQLPFSCISLHSVRTTVSVCEQKEKRKHISGISFVTNTSTKVRRRTDNWTTVKISHLKEVFCIFWAPGICLYNSLSWLEKQTHKYC